MSPLVDLTLRTSVVVVVGLTVSALLRRRSAALRHWVLAVTVFAAAVIVPLRFVLPAWDVQLAPIAVESVQIAPDLPTAPSTPTDRPPDIPRLSALRLVSILWAVGCAVGAAMLLTGVGRLLWIGSRAERVRSGRWVKVAEQVSTAYGLRRAVTLLQTDAPDILATWGVRRPRILLPPQAREWSEDRVRVVLCHELAHIRRCDWLVQMFAEVLRTLHWFNPLLWLACTRLQRESEQACDDAVLLMGVAADEYAAHLLDVARSCRRAGPAWASAVPMARLPTLERRIAAMLNPGLDRVALTPRAIAVTAALLLGISLPAAALRAAQTGPRPLEGAVYDTSGALVPQVALTLEDAQQRTTRATTDATGRFRFEPVPPGRYVLSASMIGFRPLRHELELRHAGDWERAVTLQVGELREEVSVRASRVAGARSGPSSPGPAAARIGGDIRPPRKLEDARPVYPQTMRDAGREGVVPLEAVIGRDGTVLSVRVLSAQVHPDFVIAAVDAVRQWRYEPTLLNGEPVEVSFTVSVDFSLSD